jgi:hypothetical protein
LSEFDKERKEHPTFTDKQVEQIVNDHRMLKAAGLDETPNSWRYRVNDPAKYDKFRVKPITTGVQITYARVKGTRDRWEIQNYIFDKKFFKTPESVRSWLQQHLKAQAISLLDRRAWNEYRRRSLAVFAEKATIS